MATYTGVADGNGDFTIAFSQNYTGGQKVIVKALKDGAEKSIELFAPSDAVGGGLIQFSGNLTDFPKNIRVITLSSEIGGAIKDYAMQAITQNGNIFYSATGLNIEGQVTQIGQLSFANWYNATQLTLPNSLTLISQNAFANWRALLEINIPNSVKTIADSAFASSLACKKLTLGSGLTNIGAGAFTLSACDELISLAVAPPAIQSTSFSSLKTTCVIKVPTASLSAYQAAANWSTHASKIVGV